MQTIKEKIKGHHETIKEYNKNISQIEKEISELEETIKEIDKRKPLVFLSPYTVSVTYNRVDYCDDSMYWSFGVAKRVSPLVSEKTIEKIRKYGDLRI